MRDDKWGYCLQAAVFENKKILNKLYEERVNKDVLNFSFTNRVIGQWNKLPEKIVYTLL